MTLINKRRLFLGKILFSILCFGGIISSCEDKEVSVKEQYNPSKPVILTSFSPDSGRIAEKVLLDGENFGTNADSIKVYFNKKRAAVISSTGKRMYVIVPKTPGDTCTVSVVVGQDSVVYPQPFFYKIAISVSTVAGAKGVTTYKTGTLSESTFDGTFVCVDQDDNIFVTLRSGGWTGINGMLRLNETENVVLPVGIATGYAYLLNAPCVDKKTGVVSIPHDEEPVAYTGDPKDGWILKRRDIKFAPSSPKPVYTWKHSLAACEENGYIYTRYYGGEVVKINPKTFDAEIIYNTEVGNSYGLAFHSLHPNLLYFAIQGNIFSMDINDPSGTFKKIAGGQAGHRDGPLNIAEFGSELWQMYFNPDGVLYIADANNHCIRRITTDDLVETVVGIPGVAGYKDGGKEEALFDNPRGVGVSKDGTVYVGDWGNKCIRKLAIE